MKLRWPHFHSDPNYKLRGVNLYYECKCGARRVKMAYSNMAGPVEQGWPILVNSHGQSVNDTGWRMP